MQGCRMLQVSGAKEAGSSNVKAAVGRLREEKSSEPISDRHTAYLEVWLANYCCSDGF